MERVERERRERAFRHTWILAASLSKCDALDSAEYHRIHSMWVHAGRRLPCYFFIVANGNMPGEGGEK